MAMAQQPRQALALRLHWALAAMRPGVEVDWALGPEWGWCHHPRGPREFRFAGHHHPLNECGEALSRTIPRQLRSCGGVHFSLIKRAEAVVRVVRVIRQEHEVLGVVLERVVPPSLQQEDKDSRTIHNHKIKTVKNWKQNEGKHAAILSF